MSFITVLNVFFKKWVENVSGVTHVDREIKQKVNELGRGKNRSLLISKVSNYKEITFIAAILT